MTLASPSGFAVSAEPGIQYAKRGNVLTFTIARAIYRDRTKSVPDDLTGGHGDAAFANWVWLASYSSAPAASMPTRAFGGPRHRANPCRLRRGRGSAQRRCCRLSMIRGAACQGC